MVAEAETVKVDEYYKAGVEERMSSMAAVGVAIVGYQIHKSCNAAHLVAKGSTILCVACTGYRVGFVPRIANM